MGQRAPCAIERLTASLIIGALWVIAATIVACLPMRLQYPPGIILLVVAPILIIWVGYDHGWWISVLALLAFVSMFRNPLRYFVRLAMGQKREDLP